jgi:hypothetical protein
MSAFVAAGAGFLLCVLWFDLMFDVQVLGKRERVLPEAVLASIAAYYRRVTTTARPMSGLIALVMVATLVAIGIQITDGNAPRWVGWTSLLFAAAPILLALTHTLPNAVRLGAQTDPPEVQSTLARSIFREHVACAASITAVLVLQLAFA